MSTRQFSLTLPFARATVDCEGHIDESDSAVLEAVYIDTLRLVDSTRAIITIDLLPYLRSATLDTLRARCEEQLAGTDT